MRLMNTLRRPRVILGILAGLILAGLAIVALPLALAGPAVVRITPADAASGVNPRAAIRVEFDQWVRAASVEAAVSLDPPAKFTVQADRGVVLIQPEGGLAYGRQYRLTIGPGVKNLVGRSGDGPQTVAFSTIAHIAAVRVSPERAANEVGLRAPITVEFDQPVVAVEAVAAAAQDPALADGLPQPLHLDPATIGVGRWLSPTLYGFYPEAGLLPATDYTATVRTDLAGDGSAVMEQPLTWDFRTEAPLVIEARPFDGAGDVPAGAPIEVRLIAGIDATSAGSHFVLEKAGGGAVKGAIEPIDGGFRFVPAETLERGATYEAGFAPGVATSLGGHVNASPLKWTFTVIGELEVAQVAPAPDTAEVLTDTRQISVRFNHPVVALTTIDAQAGLPQPLAITPSLPGVGRWLDTRTYVYSPTAPLDPSTAYSVEVAAGLADQTGGALKAPYRWGFATIAPAIRATTPAANATDASPFDPLTIRFNQPMDSASLQAAITLLREDTGAAVDGALEADGAVAVFTPAKPLERGIYYRLIIGTNARASAGGAAALNDSQTVAFRVAPLPALTGSAPKEGEPLNGMISLVFSTPMAWATVGTNLKIAPEPTRFYTSTYENEFDLSFEMVPDTDYVVTLGAAARDPFGATLGAEKVLRFRSPPLAPSLALVGPYQIATYSSYVPSQVLVRTTNIQSMRYELFPINPNEARMLLGDYMAWRSFAPTSAITSGATEIKGERNKERLDPIELGDLAPGLYYLRVSGDRSIAPVNDYDSQFIADQQIMAVTPYALTVKRNAGEIFAWAVDLASGEPVADLPLAAGAIGGEPQELGRTGADGTLQAPLATGSSYDSVAVWSEGGAGAVFATTAWSEGINPWDFGLAVEYAPAAIVGSLETDRPIYRPEQSVRLRGAIRGLEHEQYRLPPAGASAQVAVSDPEGTIVLSASLPLSAFGTFSASLDLDRSAVTGDYAITASVGQVDQSAIYGSFSVAEYRKPAFEVTVNPAQPDALRGDLLSFAVAAHYFSGGAVPKAPVRWRLMSRPLIFESDAAPNFGFADLDDPYAFYHWYETDHDDGAKLLADGSAVTGADGTLRLDFPGDLLAEAGSRRLTLDVEVSDIDGQAIDAQGQMRVHGGAFYVGVRPEGYVSEVGQPAAITLATLDPQEQSVANQALKVEIFQHEWFSVQEQGSDGRLYWTSRFTDTLVETQSATTDAQGRASLAFTPNAGGAYRIRASGSDSGGRAVSASAFAWAYGGAVFWGVDATNRIDLIADKRSYKPGETASILVPAPYKGMTALMTIERGGVIEHRVFTLADTTELLAVPISADHAPNVYVSVVLIKPGREELPETRVGIVNLAVSTEQQELNVTVTPDKTEAGPGDTITYTLKTTDYQGRGVQSDVALALVDKAVLALADDRNPSLRDAFYGKRPLSVFTSQSLTALADRAALRAKAGSKGGGGGGPLGLEVREDVPDTAYWNPSVLTDADGEATVTVTLPDNLTTWRMSARGLSVDTKVGAADADLLASRPLLIRPALPRFLTVGDEVALQAVVHNTTGAAIEATVTIDAGALTLASPAEQTVTVAANDRAVVRWNASAPKAGETKIALTVIGGGLRDSVAQTLPIQRFTTPEIVASGGQVGVAPVVETLKLPADSIPAGGPQGEVALELVPSLAAGLSSGLGYLEAYPYDCTEQTVSRFLPNAVTYRLFKQLGMDDAALRESLERNLGVELQRLYALQHLDGGWGWWYDDDSSPYLTAYAVQGLIEAQKAGYAVDPQALAAGITYLQTALDGSELSGKTAAWRLNARSYALYVLAEAGHPDAGRTIALFDERAKLAIYGRSYLLMTLLAINPGDARIRTLTGELMGAASLNPTTAHWEEDQPNPWTMSSDTRSTALATLALVRAEPNNFLIPNAVRYLMTLRDAGHWSTTQETAITLMALAEYVASSGELEADYRYQVSFDGQAVSEGAVNRDNLDQPVDVVMDLAKVKLDGGSQMQIARQDNGAGKGRLYYTLRLRYYQDAADVKPLDQGLILERAYVAVDQETLSATGQLISEARLGDVVQVRLTLAVPEEAHYVALEDMLPAGFEALDTSLKTVSDAAGDEMTVEGEEWRYWRYFTQTEVRDNRVALFATDLPAGTYHYAYLARATAPGTFQTLPALASQMYEPEVFGRSAGALFKVTAP